MTGKQNSNLLYGDNIYKSDASTEPPFFLQILIKVAYIYLKTFFYLLCISFNFFGIGSNYVRGGSGSLNPLLRSIAWNNQTKPE